jgi:hypothetical protein
MRGGFELGLIVVTALCAAGCGPCDRSGCTWLERHASASGTGAAGIVASESDVVANGCQECPFSETDLSAWKVDQPVQDAATAQAIIAAGPPYVSGHVVENYIMTLDPGHHLFCSGTTNCIGIEITEGEMLTVNVAQVYGPTSFRVGRPNEALANVPAL